MPDMGDVAQILAGEAAKSANTTSTSATSSSVTYPPPPPPPPRSSRPTPPSRPYGLSREILEILTDPKLRKGDVHAAPLPPMVPSLGYAAARYAATVQSGMAKMDLGGDGEEQKNGEGEDGDAIMEDTVDEDKKGKTPASKGADDAASTKQAAAAGPPPTIPRTVKVGNRTISSSKPARRWVWAPFSSSARTDSAQFSHWVRSGVEYPDYPYARFDVHLDPLSYTDEEYNKFMNVEEGPPSGLVIKTKGGSSSKPASTGGGSEEDNMPKFQKRPAWTKSETDTLIEMARIFELRWAVIHDRWICRFGADHRTVEELMHRYYSVGARLTRLRVQQAAAAEAQAAQAALRGIQQQQQAAQMQQGVIGPDGKVTHHPIPPTTSSDGRTTEELIADRTVAAAIAQADPRYQPTIVSGGTGTSNKNTFDLEAERERRRQLDLLWFRSKEEEHEEEELRAELRLVESQIRKLKKSGGHILAAQGQAGGFGAAAAARAPTPVPSGGDGTIDRALLDEAFASTAPVPQSGTPYMQSGRLENPASGGPAGLNKTLLKRMEVVLKELNVPDNPLPTKRVCDMYDSVRKDAITLITLQKICLKREQEVQGRRARLAKLGGSLAAMTASAKAKAKASKASSSSAGGASKSAPAASASGGEKKKSSSSKSKSKKSKSDKSKSKDSTKSDAAAGGDGTETKKKSKKKKKKSSDGDGDGGAKPKKKPKKSSSS